MKFWLVLSTVFTLASTATAAPIEAPTDPIRTNVVTVNAGLRRVTPARYKAYALGGVATLLIARSIRSLPASMGFALMASTAVASIAGYEALRVIHDRRFQIVVDPELAALLKLPIDQQVERAQGNGEIGNFYSRLSAIINERKSAQPDTLFDVSTSAPRDSSRP